MADRKAQMTRHSLERRNSNRHTRLQAQTLKEELISDFDPTQEERGEDGDLEIATSDSLRQTAHHDDEDNAGTVVATAIGRKNAGMKRSKIRKMSPQRHKTQGTYKARPKQINPSKSDLTTSSF